MGLRTNSRERCGGRTEYFFLIDRNETGFGTSRRRGPGTLLRNLALTRGRPVGAKGEGLEGGEGLDRPAEDSASGVVAPGAQSSCGSSPPS